MDIEQIRKYGREEAKEHRLSLKMGEKLARDHLEKYGSDYYKRIDLLERKLKKK